jgi:signal peptidase II
VKYSKYFLLTLAVIIIDQVVKLLVYKNMDLGINGEIRVIGDWFRLHYMLNEGMAFGMKLNWEYGKVLLTTFRLLASIGGIYILYYYARRDVHPGLLWSGALILAGAVGNVIDSVFYGVLLDNAPYNAPSPWFHGQVIDMLYFPIFEFTWPSWVPFVGGNYFQFFSAIFNVADASIFIGVCIILIFQKRFFPEKPAAESEPEPEPEPVSVNE